MVNEYVLGCPLGADKYMFFDELASAYNMLTQRSLVSTMWYEHLRLNFGQEVRTLVANRRSNTNIKTHQQI